MRGLILREKGSTATPDVQQERSIDGRSNLKWKKPRTDEEKVQPWKAWESRGGV